MSIALYRKYRSTSLADVVGQEHITTLLRRALDTGRVAHAYLFTGPRGVGKTSIARILAYEINQLPYQEESHHLDIIEIDAASNNGVEDIRDLREKVQIAPTSAKKKIYIIDEVHMLSKPAFNALLKTLEEPPEHVVFILATTDVNKLPATIISRTQHYSFRAIAPQVAASHLKSIATSENIPIDDDALLLIAQRGQGSFRDSISMLDQVANIQSTSDGPITAELIESLLGLASAAHLALLLDHSLKGDLPAIVRQLDLIEAEGIDATLLSQQLIEHIKGVLAENPQFLPLFDALLDVPRSSYPRMKLLSVLGRGAISPDTTAAPTSTQAAPLQNTPVAAPKKPKTVALAASPKEIVAKVSELKQVEPATPKKKAPDASVEPQAFNWDALIEHTRQNFVALFSVLSKCTPEPNGNEVLLYTANAFYKKKLDDTKYSTHLHESLVALGMGDVEITTIPERAPLKNSTASAIADIMGGGVEVAPDAL